MRQVRGFKASRFLSPEREVVENQTRKKLTEKIITVKF
jgi:hypothetical protein